LATEVDGWQHKLSRVSQNRAAVHGRLLNHHHQAIAVTYQEVFDGSAAVHGCFQSCRGNPLDALADSAMRQRIADQGMKIPPRDQQTPEALGAFQKAEIEKWWPIMKAANIKGE